MSTEITVRDISWPDAPKDPYFEQPGHVRRVHRRALAIARGDKVEQYVADIPARDKYLARCVAVAQRAVARTSRAA